MDIQSIINAIREQVTPEVFAKLETEAETEGASILRSQIQTPAVQGDVKARLRRDGWTPQGRPFTPDHAGGNARGFAEAVMQFSIEYAFVHWGMTLEADKPAETIRHLLRSEVLPVVLPELAGVDDLSAGIKLVTQALVARVHP